MHLPGWLLAAPWIVFEGWWIARTRGNARAASREPIARRVAYLSLLLTAVMMDVGRPRLGPLDRGLWPTPLVVETAGFALTLLGLGFAIWAREHLGRYWSGRITIKEDHRLIRTGPYRVVRHPIYTGALFAVVGVAVTRGDVRGVVAVPLVLAALLWKVAAEERILAAHFGDEHARYRREVRALVPFIL